MNVATNGKSEVGVRELKNHLSRYLERVRAGDEVIVTDRGRPIARLTPLDDSANTLARLVELGVVQPPSSRERSRPARGVRAKGSVSELVADQRR